MRNIVLGVLLQLLLKSAAPLSLATLAQQAVIHPNSSFTLPEGKNVNIYTDSLLLG